MKTRLLVAGLLAALAAVAVLAFASFGGATSRSNADNGARAGARQQPWEVKKSKFPLIAAVDNDSTSFIYNKGFVSITHPATGTYCLRPKASKYTPFTHPAIVTPDWWYSSGEQLLAFFTYDEDCLPSEYEVLTYDLSNALSDNVAFQIAVQ